MSSNRIRTGILGASGYTGAELVRLLSQHPRVDIALLTADSHAGEPFADVYPHLGSLDLPDLISIDEVEWAGLDLDVVFCGLPHGTTQEVIAGIMHQTGHDLVDELIEETPQLQDEAVYGLTELGRDEIRDARLVACPGCYPTVAILPLAPLLSAGQILTDDIIIDAKTGITGAGRAAKQANLFGEISEGMHAYGVARHRHGPEIEQELERAVGRAITVNFTPHLVPMNRGILATIYVKLSNGVSADDLRATLTQRYADEPFVLIAPEGQAPATRHVRGSNNCVMGVFADRLPGRAIIVAVIDNLVKGASGQAVQNMNLMFDLDETTALSQQPLFP